MDCFVASLLAMTTLADCCRCDTTGNTPERFSRASKAPLSSPLRKNILVSENRKLCLIATVPPGHEGRYGQSSRNVGRDAMDASTSTTIDVDAYGQAVWS